MSIRFPENIYGWEPVKNRVFKDEELADVIHKRGFAILPWIDEEAISRLRDIYNAEHDINVSNGGMFYTMYSRDLDYRLCVNEEIGNVLKPILQEHFKDYKNIVNSFVVKAAGKESEFYVHQDTTALDEFKFSPLSLWIPLHEINERNGALAIIEKTHWFFSPFRGVSFRFPFKGILNTVRKYLKPIYMKKGDVLLFDPRIIHNSMANSSGEDRVAIICGVFDQEAELITCFKDPSSEQSPIELYKHEDDYTLKYPNFFYNCHTRPTSGTKVGEEPEFFPDMDVDTFEDLCARNNIEAMNILGDESGIQCNMIAEPDGVNKYEEVELAGVEIRPKKSGFWSWFKR